MTQTDQPADREDALRNTLVDLLREYKAADGEGRLKVYQKFLDLFESDRKAQAEALVLRLPEKKYSFKYSQDKAMVSSPFELGYNEAIDELEVIIRDSGKL